MHIKCALVPTWIIHLLQSPSVEMTRAAWVLRTLLLNEHDQILRERKTAGGRLLVPCCASGSEMVAWLAGLAPGVDRHQATTMWQALLEEGLVYHGKNSIISTYTYYRRIMYNNKIKMWIW